MFAMLIIVLLLFVFGGAIGHSRYGYVGWSPAGVILLALAFLYLTGHFSGNLRIH
jgi:hypothetical protein